MYVSMHIRVDLISAALIFEEYRRRLSISYIYGKGSIRPSPQFVSVPTQQTQNISITFIQCCTNFEDVQPTLYKCNQMICVSCAKRYKAIKYFPMKFIKRECNKYYLDNLILILLCDLLTKLIQATYIAVADPGGGGGGLSRHAPPPPPYFRQNILRSPPNWLTFTKKNLGASPQNLGRPPFIKILDPPLHSDKRVGCRTSIIIYNSITLQCACGKKLRVLSIWINRSVFEYRVFFFCLDLP